AHMTPYGTRHWGVYEHRTGFRVPGPDDRPATKKAALDCAWRWMEEHGGREAVDRRVASLPALNDEPLPEHWLDLDALAEAFLDAALVLGPNCPDRAEEYGEKSGSFRLDDFSEAALAWAAADCRRFLREHRHLIPEGEEDRAGADFYLS